MSSHSGRHTFTTRLNAKGVGMRTLIGPRHIGTTRYIVMSRMMSFAMRSNRCDYRRGDVSAGAASTQSLNNDLCRTSVIPVEQIGKPWQRKNGSVHVEKQLSTSL